MIFPALSDEATAAGAEAVRAWSDVLAAWSSFLRAPGAQNPIERWQAMLGATAHAQQATLRASALVAAGSHFAVTPFGLTGLFCAVQPAEGDEPAARPQPATPTALPETAPSKAQRSTPPGAKPQGDGIKVQRPFQALAKPLGRADDLLRIKGVGPKTQEKLNRLGVFHFWQIASLSRAEAERLDTELGVNGRVMRDGWVSQAKRLAEDVPA